MRTISRVSKILLPLLAAHTMNSRTVFVEGTTFTEVAGISSTTNASKTVAAVPAKLLSRVSSVTSEGVEVPGHVVVDGTTTLIRNGHGKRSITYFGLSFRIYVAAMYSSKPILSADQVLGATTTPSTEGQSTEDIVDGCPASDTHGPLQFDFTFLRHVRRSQVVSAWTQQLDHSVTLHDYEGYQDDKVRFIALASGGPIEYHGTQSIQLVGDETRIIDQGTLTGVIRGTNFQRAFLSMWFGSMAVAEDLKDDLLNGDQHEAVQQLKRERPPQHEQQQQVLMAV